MAGEKDTGVGSDAEQPVREQLKKATIGPEDSARDNDDAAVDTAAESNGQATAAEGHGSPMRKRSFDEVEGDERHEPASQPARHHSRKRSRDSTANEEVLNNGQRKTSGEQTRTAEEAAAVDTDHKAEKPSAKRQSTPEHHASEKLDESAAEALASPKTKRSRLHAATREDDRVSESASPAKTETEDAPKPSGFSNSSISSPFAALKPSSASRAEPAQTSASAFAASGFGALSKSTTSGFGALGKTSGGGGGFGGGAGFGGGGQSPAKPSTSTTADSNGSKDSSGSTFGGALGQKSAFASSNSTGGGFASVSGPSAFGGGFASSGFGALGGEGGLSTFGSGKPPSAFGASGKPAKAFGAAPDDDADADQDGGEDDSSGIKSPLSQESEKQDERFYKQDLETGEEDESTVYSCRAKLYNFLEVGEGKKEWKERGLGMLRLNVKKTEDEENEAPPTARLLMRADGSHRVILNTPVKKEIKYGAPDGTEPKGGYIYFMGTMDGKANLELLQLKIKQQNAFELFTKITELQTAM